MRHRLSAGWQKVANIWDPAGITSAGCEVRIIPEDEAKRAYADSSYQWLCITSRVVDSNAALGEYEGGFHVGFEAGISKSISDHAQISLTRVCVRF